MLSDGPQIPYELIRYHLTVLQLEISNCRRAIDAAFTPSRLYRTGGDDELESSDASPMVADEAGSPDDEGSYELSDLSDFLDGTVVAEPTDESLANLEAMIRFRFSELHFRIEQMEEDLEKTVLGEPTEEASDGKLTDLQFLLDFVWIFCNCCPSEEASSIFRRAMSLARLLAVAKTEGVALPHGRDINDVRAAIPIVERLCRTCSEPGLVTRFTATRVLALSDQLAEFLVALRDASFNHRK